MSEAKGAQWWCTYILRKTINCSDDFQIPNSGPGSTKEQMQTMKELDYAKKNLEKLPIGPLPWSTGPPAPVYVTVCDDVHHEVDRNGTGGIFLRITQ